MKSISTLSLPIKSTVTLTKSFIFILFLASCGRGEDQADAYGNFESDERIISAEISALLVSCQFEEGQQVTEGDLLAVLDSTQLWLKKGQLLASIEALKSRLQDVPVQVNTLLEREKVLETELGRVRKLLQDSAATIKQFDDLTGELEVVKAQARALENQLSTNNKGILAEIKPLQWQVRQLEDQIAKCRVRAPISGTILARYKEEDELVITGQPLFKLADLRQLTLRAYLSEPQLGLVKPGQDVQVKTDRPDGDMESFAGRITWIASEAEFTPKVIQTREERVNLVYAIKVQVPNDGSLKVGMPGELFFPSTTAAQ